MNILIIGSGAREHAMTQALARSPSRPTLFCCGTTHNPGIRQLTTQYWCGDIRHIQKIAKQALDWNINLAVIGPEAPLEKGLVDILEQQGIPTVGPKEKLAQIETSKSFARNLLQKYHIPGSPRYQRFDDLNGVKTFLSELGEGQYVIKADGLMAGKGVKVAGDHLHSFQDAFQFCQELSHKNIPFLIEEKLIGQEFSLLCFSDGECVIPMPLVQDHKRAFVNDAGPNTGGMGSYSDANHSLPFLTTRDIVAAQKMNQAVLTALREEYHEPYKGILYGSFMATQNGVYLIEYNARFGDPEAMNILSILDSDFTALCYCLALGQLSQEPVQFKPLATVCKYAVPYGYPDTPLKNIALDVSQVKNKERLYFASVDEMDGALLAKGSRAIAVVGMAPTLFEAEKIAEEEISRIQGQIFHREDIGTVELINQRIQMMKELRQRQHAS